MPGTRLPFTELVTAVRSRIQAADPSRQVWSLAPQGTPRPYLELGDIVFQDQSSKDPGAFLSIQLELHAYSEIPNMQELNSMLSSAVRAITSGGYTLTGYAAHDPLVEGAGSVRKEADSLGVFWHGQVTLNFVISDTQGGME